MNMSLLAGSLLFHNLVAIAPPAPTADHGDSVAELKETVRRLQEQVDRLTAQSDDNWLTEARAGQIKSLVQDVLADADTRASLLQSGVAAGWDRGFFMASADGNYKLFVGGQIQIRAVYNHQDNSPVDDHRWGIENRRTKLILRGNVVDPTWTFDIQLAVNRSTGVVALEDAGWLQKDLGDGWKIRAGQQKAPFLREEVTSSQRMMAIERSLLNAIFTEGTVQGVTAMWESDQFRASGQLYDGPGSANTPWSMEDTEIAAAGRLEWLAQGEWSDVNDYTSFRDEGAAILIGGAVAWSKAEFGTGMAGPPPVFNNAEAERLSLTADATLDFGGANISGVIVYRNIDVPTAGASMDQWGFLLRGAIFITDTWELYAQYEWADLDTVGVADLSVLTVGISKYWAKHALKWQTDVGFGFDSVDPLVANDAAGWRADAPTEEGQIVVRSQIQLLF